MDLWNVRYGIARCLGKSIKESTEAANRDAKENRPEPGWVQDQEACVEFRKMIKESRKKNDTPLKQCLNAMGSSQVHKLGVALCKRIGKSPPPGMNDLQRN